MTNGSPAQRLQAGFKMTDREKFLDWCERKARETGRGKTWIHDQMAKYDRERLGHDYQPQLDYRLREHERKQYPKYNKTPVAPLPELVLIQFIGGPKNGEQIYYNWKENPDLKQGAIWNIVDELTPIKNWELNQPYHNVIQTLQYKLTFIPQSETPFSDAQIAIGIFQ